MNLIEAMKVVHNRIKQVEPENIAKKIIGYLLYTQDNADHNMIRLAFYPDSVMLSVIDCVKHELAKGYHHILNFQDSMNRHDQKYPPRTTRRKLPEFPVINCHYFRKGYCKNGNNCRFFHVEEHVVSPGSLEKLEREIIELLKSRRGAPISIASLPMMYSEKYGKSLQAEGYLTESQRHGKAGYSLTKLLARLSNTIRLLDRPHGQHSVILAEDVSKFVESPGTILSSRQIYLTFPAESSFSENDVSNYFSKFGHVEDVRIPCQQKRMFGFVTFAYKETAKIILSKPNPHFISGAKVLVKPYQDKTRPTTRYLDHNNTLPQRVSQTSRLMRKQFLEHTVSNSLLTYGLRVKS